MHILDGKTLRDEIKAKLKEEVKSFKGKPCLCIIQVGDRPESNAYIGSKKKFGEAIGAIVLHEKFEESVSNEEIIEKILSLNSDASVHGIIVQLPIPSNLDQGRIMDAVTPTKDVDGMSAVNVKKMWEEKKDAFVPATTKGVLTLLEHHGIPLSGKDVLVIGRSSLVGKPTALLALANNATVTVAHSKTKDLLKHTRAADIIIVAAGKPKLLGIDHVMPHQVIIDVGINSVPRPKEKGNEAVLQDEIPEKMLVGDVDFENVKNAVSAITPVPGGVGPMTVASLFLNVVEAYTRSL